MKKLQVGSIFKSPEIISTAFLSDKYILDYDLYILDLNSIKNEINTMLSLSSGIATRLNYTRLQTALQERKKQIAEYYKLGGTVVLIVNSFPEYSFKVNTQNQLSTETIDIFKFIFDLNPSLSYESRQGDILEHDRIMEGLVDGCKFHYQVLFENVIAKKILWTQKVKKTASFISKIDNGLFICIPGFSFKPSIATSESGNLTASKRLDELVISQKQIEFVEEVIEPEWIANYNVGTELEEKNKLSKLSDQFNQLKAKIQQQETVLKKYSDIKALLYLDGTPLEYCVKKYLEQIGFAVEKPSGFDVDLILQYQEFVGALEIKGVKGSGAKSHVRQLENWVNNYSIANNSEAKGILIINTYKQLPIFDRSEISFPSDMITFSIQRDHCLLLTNDLVNIFIDFEQNLIDINEITILFKTCVGVLNYHPRFQQAVN